MKASKVEQNTLPSAILRSVTASVSLLLSELLVISSDRSTTNNRNIPSSSSSSILCVRLREAPTTSLRRVCRLYLCATSGPGEMRNTGTNAWRSVPDTHNKDLQHIPVRTQCVSPPGSSWHTITYPGKEWRLRIKSCHFMRAHIPHLIGAENDEVDCPCIATTTTAVSAAATNVEREIDDHFGKETKKKNNNTCPTSKSTNNANDNNIQVFSTVESFHQWEFGVVIRENCDFLLELNDMILYNERKRAREEQVEDKNNADDDEADDHRSEDVEDTSASEDSSTCTTPTEETKLDYYDLLTIAGRSKFIEGILAMKKEECKDLISEIERHISTLLGTPFGDRPLSTLVGISFINAMSSRCVEKSSLTNECEKILGVTAIILIHVLEFRHTAATMMQQETTAVIVVARRPWLRHMCWEGCVSYVLWDLIPLLERRGYYDFAIHALEVLLFGRRLETATHQSIPTSLVVAAGGGGGSEHHVSLISRRARGKALDRLIIDYTHRMRKHDAVAVTKHEKTQTQKGVKKGKARKTKKKILPKSTASEIVALLIKPLLIASVGRGQITFSAIRTLARRLKCPLSCTLQGLELYEAKELGHRLADGKEEEEEDSTRYNDWRPVTDSTVANALTTDRNTAGGRCSFVGFEEEDDQTNPHFGSLNVEELAKEYYHQGRLPVVTESTTIKGGWTGYHDEGGKIRALYRILSSKPLGMDWELTRDDSNVSSAESSTIHLTPYQGAPFDLHVGAENIDTAGSGGIYLRRKASIDDFLSMLSNLNGEDLSNFVYDCIENCVDYANSHHRSDLTLEHDVQHVRTLSMLAVGFGGKMLASIFRCFFFDYRHYSGGLPDLLLVRAIYKSSTNDDGHIAELVDLGKWVGEAFSEEHQADVKAKQAAHLFTDTDGDFLGCSKVGDSGTRRFKRSNGRGMYGSKKENEDNAEANISISMPARLSLCHNSRRITVECMFVEVKSQNDRLDSRQEDWLNILDIHGNARVCQFEKPPKRNNNAKKKKKS